MSAIIYAAIVVIWLIVLVPMWLRRHDAAMDERSNQRFEGAMRVLARRPVHERADRRYVVMPRRSAATAVHVSAASAVGSDEAGRSKSGAGSLFALLFHGRRRGAVADGETETGVESADGLGSAAAAAAKRRPHRPVSMATRRRRTLLGLLALTVLCIFVSSVGALPAAIQVIPELLLVAFVVHLRLQARQTAAGSRQRRRDAAAPDSRPRPSFASRETTATRRSSDFLFGDRRTAWPEVAAETTFSGWAGVGASAAMRGEHADVEASALGSDAEDDSWDPKPWPKPTYAMKPAAPPADPALVDEEDDVEPTNVNLGPGVESELFDDDGELDLILERDDVQPYRAPRAVND